MSTKPNTARGGLGPSGASEITDPNAARDAQIRALRETGMSFRRISATLGVPLTTVHRAHKRHSPAPTREARQGRAERARLKARLKARLAQLRGRLFALKRAWRTLDDLDARLAALEESVEVDLEMILTSNELAFLDWGG